MNIENQHKEWKESWRDEYIKWICGFANANGGVLYIGIDDKGGVTGIPEPQKLLETIPNKVKDILGIVVDVNILSKDDRDYLEIVVEPQPFPVNYKGQYHYRSGSTKLELKGTALDKFLLQKQGKHWDGVPVPNVSVGNLSKNAFINFRTKASRSKRLSSDMLQDNDELIIEKLHLTEGSYLKRAAILLFHPDPEKFVTGAFIKIGFFRTDEDLLYQDEIHGHLFEQVDKTMDLLLTKYLKATISYDGVTRVELFPFPEAALREALLNSIAHKDYSSGNPIQISVYDDHIVFWNEGQLPENWTVERLLHKHPSVPFNPDVAATFFRSGLIESWGRGTLKILNECLLAQLPPPVFKYDLSGFMIEFYQRKEIASGKTSGKPSGKMSGKTSDKVLTLISENHEITIPELSLSIGVSERSIERTINKLQKNRRLERIGGAKGGKWNIIDPVLEG
jgi:ATP-dependent DNA helicase RecG